MWRSAPEIPVGGTMSNKGSENDACAWEVVTVDVERQSDGVLRGTCPFPWGFGGVK